MCTSLLVDALATFVQLLGGDWLCGDDCNLPNCQWLASSVLFKQKISDGSRLGGETKILLFVCIMNFPP